jgi:hypothetical protein
MQLGPNSAPRRAKPLRRFAIVATGVLATAGAGCTADGEGRAEAADMATSTPPRPANLGPTLHIRGDTVELKMDEYIFGFPSDTLPAGRVVFQIQNLGFEGHNLEIHRGDSLIVKLEHDMSPAETQFLEVTLEPGDYEFICTVAGHDGKGMRETITFIAGDW